MQNRTQRVILAMAGLSLLLATVSARGQTVTKTVPVDYTGAVAAAVNLATNKVYVASPSGSNAGAITVIDGATNSYTTIFADSSDSNPHALAVNSVTNKIYVANEGSSSVSVIDGSTDTITTTVTVGTSPLAIAVNPLTNMIYVANSGSNNVTVINGATNTATPVADPNAQTPQAIAVNPVTNRIYVANFTSGNVTVIDGSTGTYVATVGVGTNPVAVAVNPVSNKIYVANESSSNVSVINGATNTVSSTIGYGGQMVAVNPASNQIFTAYSNTVYVIDGTTDTVADTVTNSGSSAEAVAVNPLTNKAYVAFANDSNRLNLMVVDGTTYSAPTLTDSNVMGPFALALNPVTNKAYVVNSGSYNVDVVDGADYQDITVSDPVATYPAAVAVNPVTNMAYVANRNSNNVTVINGSDYSTTVNVGTSPTAVAVNPVTNLIYVVNFDSNTVSVIAGASNTVTATVTDPNAAAASAVAVNPLTNAIYVANFDSNNVTVINGATNSTTTVTDPNATNPTAVAVNEVTNQIYVANSGSNNVTVIDGATNNVIATVDVGTDPVALAVNEKTNKIYVANYTGGTNNYGNVSVIDGATNTVAATLTDPYATNPTAVDINNNTNTIYVANFSVSSDFWSVVTVIDGTSDTYVASVYDPNASGPMAVAVNKVTNKIYVPSSVAAIIGETGTFNALTVIDGATNTVTELTIPTVGANPGALAVNTFTNTVYIADSGLTTGADEVIPEQQVQAIPILTSVTPLPGNLTASLTPTFSFTATNNLTPPTPIDNLLFQTGTWQGPWLVGTNQGGGSFSGTVSTSGPGIHVVYAFSTEGEEGGATSPNWGVSPLIGNITAYGFLVGAPEASLSPGSLTFSNQGYEANSTAATVTLTNAGSAPLNVTAVAFGGEEPGDFSETDNCGSSPIAAGGTCTVNVTFTPTALGTRTATLLITDNSGDKSGNQQTISITGTAIQATTSTGVVPSANPTPFGQPVVLTATVTPQGTGTPTGTVTFDDGTTPLPSCSNVALSSAQAACTASGLAIGLHSITAVYSGDTNFQGSTSSALSLNVGKIAATVTLGNLTQTYTGSALTPTVTTVPAGLAITWTGTPQTNAGTYPVTATVNDATYQGSASGTFTINQAATTTTVTATGSPVLGQPVTANFKVTVNPPGAGTISAIDTVTVTDSTGASCTGTIAAGNCALTPKFVGADTLTATFNGDTNYSKSSGSTATSIPVSQGVSLSGLTATKTPDQPTTVGVALNTPATTQLNGTLTLSFVSNAAGTGEGYIDPMTCFIDSNNQCATQLNFTIPVGASAPTLPNNGTVQQGTTAGTITVTLTALTAGGTSVLPQPPPSVSVVVAPIAPVIKSVTIINQSATGFSIQVTAFSTPRDLATAQFTFVAATGSDLNGSSPSPVALADTAQAYFSSANGALGGGTFVLTVPFSFSGDTSALGSVGVSLLNSVGASASASQTF